MQSNQYKIKDKVKKSPLYKIWEIIKVLAPVGFILSITFFVISTFNAKRSSAKLVENLLKIEQSLSTRHIGIFPNYLPQINELLENANTEEPVIVFQDVLYYGIFSTPQGFKKMVSRLLELSKKCRITIVYYDIDENQNRAFLRSVQESRIQSKYLGALTKDRTELLRKWRNNRNGNNYSQNLFAKADSIVCEKYFVYSREDANFKNKVKQYLIPLYDSQLDSDSLFYRIDEIKREHIGKSVTAITFQDFFNMYRMISEELIAVFNMHDIELIGINESHIMSCWQNNDKAILAFPSKYATNEIGFYTQDPIFSEYIETMLKGVKEQRQ